MTPQEQQRVQVLEHDNRRHQTRLDGLQKTVHALENEMGEIRCKMQTNDNEIHRIISRKVCA